MDNRSRSSIFDVASCIAISNAALYLWYLMGWLLAGGQEETALEEALFIYPWPAVWIASMVILGLRIQHPPIVESGIAVVSMCAVLVRSAGSTNDIVGSARWFGLLWIISFTVAEVSRQLRKWRNHQSARAAPGQSPQLNRSPALHRGVGGGPRILRLVACVVISNMAILIWWTGGISITVDGERTSLERVLSIWPFPAIWISCMFILGQQSRHPPIIESAMSVVGIVPLIVRLTSDRGAEWASLKQMTLMWGISFVLAEGSRQIRGLLIRRQTNRMTESGNGPPP